MKFSIIVPLYNKAESVLTTLLSILNQSYKGFEVIVVNDGSTDGSEKIVEAVIERLSETGNVSNLTLYNQINQGVSAARNFGVIKAQYENLVFVDADDLLADCYLDNICDLMKAYPNAGAYGTCYQYKKQGKFKRCKIHQMGNQATLFSDYFDTASKGDLPIIASATCVPKRVLNHVGLFPVDQTQGEDQDLWSRIGWNYPVAVHPSIDVTYVLDAENRVSIDNIPDSELAFSKNLQERLDSGTFKQALVKSVQRYIAGHLIHLAELNYRAGKYTTAREILSDSRTNAQWKRKLKWMAYLALGSRLRKNKAQYCHPEKKRYTVTNLLNDKDMGGILTVIKSLANSNIARKFNFLFKLVKPSKPYFKSYASDIIMVHYASSWSTIMPNLILRIVNYQSKVILQEHHYTKSFESAVPSQFRFRLMLRINYLIFNKVIAVSNGQANWIKSANLINPGNLQIIPQSRSLNSLLKVKPKLTEKVITLGAYGRLCPAKGFDLLIKAFNMLTTKNIRLEIAGCGPSESELKELAGDNPMIKFHGLVSDIPTYLSNCDVIIIPSLTEPFGLACLESKAAGKAVIVSDIDGLSEQVETRKEDNQLLTCGYKLESVTVKNLLSTLNRIPDMPLVKWGSNGRLQVANAWEIYQRRWSELFSQLAVRR